jgi:hypothetical protein
MSHNLRARRRKLPRQVTALASTVARGFSANASGTPKINPGSHNTGAVDDLNHLSRLGLQRPRRYTWTPGSSEFDVGQTKACVYF